MNNLKSYLSIILLISSTPVSFATELRSTEDTSRVKIVIWSANRIDSASASILKDTCTLNESDSTNKQFRKVQIIAIPKEASDVSIMFIQVNKIEIHPGVKITDQIVPDTIGVWKVPIAVCLSLGSYDIIATREGFKSVVKNISVEGDWKKDISFELLSDSYLQYKQEQWATYKWICGAAFGGSAAVMAYFNIRINQYTVDYNNATMPDVISGKRSHIFTNQSNFKTSSIIAFSALGGFAVSWLIESLYSK